MEDSSHSIRAKKSQNDNFKLKPQRSQSRILKSRRVTFKTESIDKNSKINLKPEKSSSTESEVDLTKTDEKFSNSKEELKSKFNEFNSKTSLIEDQGKIKKKYKRKVRKLCYRLKKPKLRFIYPMHEIQQLKETDRPILIKYFKDIIGNFLEQKRRNKLLQRKLKLFLIRRNETKAFKSSSDKNKDSFRHKYYKNLEKIHELGLEVKHMMEAFNVEKLVSMKKKDELLKIKNDCVQDFHATVYSKAQEVQTSTPIPERAIKRHLNQFHKLYNQVSNIRKINFKTQQLIAEYAEKEKKIEDIGDGLTLFEYENTKTKLQILNSNIDAKNKVLERMRTRIKKDTIDNEKCTADLKKLDAHLQKLEESHQKLKAEHAKLFNESKKLKNLEKHLNIKLNDIYIKGQLLSERSLMVDYDKMDERLTEKKDEMTILKDENQKLDQKLRKYEEELKTLKVEKGKAEKNVEPLSLYEEKVALFRKTRTSLKFG